MAFDAIKTEVVARLGGRTDIDTRVDIWINDAYFELLLGPLYAFHEIEKQATAQTIDTLRAYDLPSDLWFILSIRDDTNNRKLRRSHWSSFDKRSASSGIPNRYARFADTVELDPTPDDAYDLIIRYRIRPDELSSTVAPVTGREWDELITVLSTAKGWEALEQQERAAAQWQLFGRLSRQRMDIAQLEDMDSETTIGVRLE
jgi:hypothetical protein